ncbi:MAG: sigma-54-dependent Fis family transcriptional regulator [Deltaproteobacteria bacterium]|nr:sigma-54-dependent Fis family transcriptional regulator [Deltaproteobacteria bacterium]
MGSILVIDDERSMREFLAICLKRAGYRVTTAEEGEQALQVLEAQGPFDLVITDLKMPGPLDGLAILDQVKARAPDTQVIVITAYATTETAISAMKRGAYDYLTKPFKVDEISVVVERALERQALVHANAELREQVQGRFRLASLSGKSPAMQRIFELIRKIAPTRTNVLITGESGTGKELVARALHFEGPRAQKPFIAVNCGAIPETLLESELFGHVKGAFTGAGAAKEGLFAAADGGTLFLDEIGELSTPLQVKLLRVLQERKIKPVGGIEERPIDVRIITATNRDLEAEVARGAFRQDLYYRLKVIQVHLPPLRQRREDMPILVETFVKRFAGEMAKRIVAVTPDAMSALCAYDYPGNVRELENIIERAVTLEASSRITCEALPQLEKTKAAGAQDGQAVEIPAEGIDLDRILSDYEREIVLKALKQSGGTRKEAARLLRITFRSLRYRLEKLGIDSGLDERELALPPHSVEE